MEGDVRGELIVLRVKSISGFKYKNQRICVKDSITLRYVQEDSYLCDYDGLHT